MTAAECPCIVCGASGGQPCVALRSGRPLKYFHRHGRVIVVPARALRIRAESPPADDAAPLS